MWSRSVVISNASSTFVSCCGGGTRRSPFSLSKRAPIGEERGRSDSAGENRQGPGCKSLRREGVTTRGRRWSSWRKPPESFSVAPPTVESSGRRRKAHAEGAAGTSSVRQGRTRVSRRNRRRRAVLRWSAGGYRPGHANGRGCPWPSAAGPADCHGQALLSVWLEAWPGLIVAHVPVEPFVHCAIDVRSVFRKAVIPTFIKNQPKWMLESVKRFCHA